MDYFVEGLKHVTRIIWHYNLDLLYTQLIKANFLLLERIGCCVTILLVYVLSEYLIVPMTREQVVTRILIRAGSYFSPKFTC